MLESRRSWKSRTGITDDADLGIVSGRLFRQRPDVRVFILQANVKVMAHPLAGANVERGVRVEIRWKHRKQRG
jgi:hypothetical protein